MSVVLDTSAVLALLWNEAGAERVADAMADARISTVNLAELVGKLVDRGASDRDAAEVIQSLGLEAVGFDADQAFAAGVLRRSTRAAGLSIGDRACLSLAKRDGRVALTADRSWNTLELEIDVELIR